MQDEVEEKLKDSTSVMDKYRVLAETKDFSSLTAFTITYLDGGQATENALN
jgi:hypothetical protein